jgi:hypothetical protein
VLGRQKVSFGLGIVVDDTPCYHRAKPLPNVSLVQLCGSRDLGERGGGQGRHAVEEPGPMPDAHHERERGVVDDLEGSFAEAFCRGLLERCNCHAECCPLLKPDPLQYGSGMPDGMWKL